MGEELHYGRNLWQHRELFFVFFWREFLIRYKQTAFDFGWILLKPLLTGLALIAVFGRFVNAPANGVPYPLLVFVAVLPWQFFTDSIARCGNSVVLNSHIVTKVYFPRFILPSSSILLSFSDFFAGFTFLIPLLCWYAWKPNVHLLFLPIFVITLAMTALGIGLWLSALNVRYRDVGHILPFFIQIATIISPVGFSSQIIPARWRMLYAINPMTGVIDGFRWTFLGNQTDFSWVRFFISFSVAALVFISGFLYFKKSEGSFPDYI